MRIYKFIVIILLMSSCESKDFLSTYNKNEIAIFYFDESIEGMSISRDSLPNNRKWNYNFELENYKDKSQLNLPLKLVFKDFKNFDYQFAYDSTTVFRLRSENMVKYDDKIWTLERLSSLSKNDLLKLLFSTKNKFILDVSELEENTIVLREVYREHLSVE
ncbi:hypothetical protein JM84_0983 [Dokdonia sp. Hel_I_63]|uniref:hypothetical protein n=1 Tax=Dokdonia sp. (strain 4H-3-7-5) TaxID=983548 RepID=UPI00020A74B8|nr:hypothetical protein [Dokdonia sp. 4H-3-7-5]AEE18672.1 hypothetical protein Krodi_0688 [Dokdonia sp. 4H-3-7-5]TVZ22099.1 hypothetical protein JM84_0983 [Dokdonia sp. Hel_I_63]